MTKNKGRQTRDVSPNGLPLTLIHDLYYSGETGQLSHSNGRTVTFKDHRGNYAVVRGVRNPLAWLRRHGYGNTFVAQNLAGR